MTVLLNSRVCVAYCFQAISRMPLSILRNVMASEYFGHFCMLMHLEHMEELRQIRPNSQHGFHGPM